MSTYSGSMSIYFPCKLKSGFPVSSLNDRWDRWRKRQIDFIHHSHAPLTDLMDREKNRNINEAFLKVFQKTLASNHVMVDEQCAPYGLKCIQCAYRKKREDNIFSKNVQLLLSRFKLEYCIKNKTLTTEGCLLLNVNADNSVATFIVVLNFANCGVDDIIYLKHIFYKRLLVCISEYDTESQNCDCSICSWMECQKIVSTCQPIKTTIQDFVNCKGRRINLLNKLKYDFDYRARYSFVKLVNPIDKFVTDFDEYLKLKPSEQKENVHLLNELYGILSADECFSHFPCKKLFEVFKVNSSTRMDYDLYTSNLNAIIVTKKLCRNKSCCQLHAESRQGYNEPDENVKTEQMEGPCLPGLLEGRFPSFLKAVEVHYLINKVTTNEIAIHERSFLNPFIFLKRLWLLWEILYDVDSHKYHVSRHFQEAFGISKQLEDIRSEYNSLLNHSLSYSMAVVTVIAAIFTFIQLWK